MSEENATPVNTTAVFIARFGDVEIEMAKIDVAQHEDMLGFLQMLKAAPETLEALCKDRDLLLEWANESVNGGWSTHQVGAMRKRAAELAPIIRAAGGQP